MLRSVRLTVVLALEERRENEALVHLGEAREEYDAQCRRLDELRQYQADYQQQMRVRRNGVLKVSQLQQWQAFVSQLDQAILQQQRLVARTEAELNRRRDLWRVAYEKRRGMEKFIESCRAQEEAERGRQEQKQVDEAAGRYALRKRP